MLHHWILSAYITDDRVGFFLSSSGENEKNDEESHLEVKSAK